MMGRALSDPQSSTAAPRFQLATTDLFWLVAFAAAIALAFATKWTTYLPFLFSLGVAILIGVCFVGLRRRVLIAVFVVLMVLTMALDLFPPVAIQLILLMLSVAGLGLWIWPGKPAATRTRLRVSLVCIAAGMLIGNFAMSSRLQKLLTAQAEYPFQDISSRLEYELHHETDSESRTDWESQSQEDQTDEDQTPHLGMRSRTLERIHDEQYERFVRSFGFGISRMAELSTFRINTPEIPVIGFSDEVIVEVEDVNSEGVLSWGAFLRRNASDKVTDGELSDSLTPPNYHAAGRDDFLHPETFGYVETRKNVAGFLPHAFHFPLEPLKPSRAGRWELTQLQLISLLRFNRPSAYVLDHLPRMDYLTSDDVSTRPLDEFELAALARLRESEDVVFEESSDSIRMLGALRAATTCLDCHDVEQGELLGAFTYEFRRK